MDPISALPEIAGETKTVIRRFLGVGVECTHRFSRVDSLARNNHSHVTAEVESLPEPNQLNSSEHDQILPPGQNCSIPVAREMGSTAIKAAKKPPRIGHLNGLRAVALIGILTSHFQYTSPVATARGLFLGVDVFCVLSGYLITLSTATQISQGRFSYSSFLLQRFWRLCPTLLCASLCTILTAQGVLSTKFILDIAHSADASTFAILSTLFATEKGDVGSISLILFVLRAWSLCTEWRLYLIWPVVMVCVSLFFGHRRLTTPCLVLVTALIVYGVIFTVYGLRAAFLLLPGPTMGFGLGSLLVAAPAIQCQKVGNAMSLGGTAMISYSFVYLSTIHSVPAALWIILAQLGALLVIASPSTAAVNRIYDFSPFSYLGGISYSACLMHCPMFLLYQSIYGLSSAPLFARFALVVATLAVSTLMHHFVEAKFRSGKQWWQMLGSAFLLASMLLTSWSLASVDGEQIRLAVATRTQLSQEHVLSEFMRYGSEMRQSMLTHTYQHLQRAWQQSNDFEEDFAGPEVLNFSDSLVENFTVQSEAKALWARSRSGKKNSAVVGEGPAFPHRDLQVANGSDAPLLQRKYNEALDPQTSRQYFKMAAQDHIATFKPLCINTRTEKFVTRKEPKVCGGYNRTIEWMPKGCDSLEQSHERESNLVLGLSDTMTTTDWIKEQERMRNVHWVEGLTVFQMYDRSCGNIAHFVGRATMLQHVLEHINAYAAPPNRIENIVVVPEIHTLKRFSRPQNYAYWHDTFLRAILSPSKYVIGTLGSFVHRASSERAKDAARAHLLQSFSMAGSDKPDGTVVCFRHAVVPGFFKGRFFASDSEYPSEMASRVRSRLPGAPDVPRDALRMRERVSAVLNSSTDISSIQKRIVFVDRGGSRRAIPQGQKQKLFDFIKKAGKERGFVFESVSFEGMNFEEQVSVMNNAGIAIGVHGANLVNTMFMVRLFESSDIALLLVVAACDS